MGPRRAVPPTQKGSQAAHRAPAVQAPGPVARERYPRRVRLTRGADLTACWDAGRRRHAAHLEVAWRRNERGHPRFGVIVPRFQHSAVARNRLRRRLRELLRRGLLQQLPPVDVVVRARRGAYNVPFTQLRDELTHLVSRVS